MTTPSEKDREVAARIYEQLLYHASCGKDFLECKDCASRLTGSIAQALALAMEEGRAEGDCAKTADGKRIEPKMRIWFNGDVELGDKETDWAEVSRISQGDVILRPVHGLRVKWLAAECCYSTKESAEAARTQGATDAKQP